MFKRKLSSFVPSVYKEVVEMDDIMNAEERITNIARDEMYTAFANTFVLTANESGVIMFEKMLGIVANPYEEDLQFRRQRILNRLSMSPPFTFRFLKQKLDEIIGKGGWKAYIDFDNYTLYIESSATNANWYSEIEFTINQIKPCNMVFMNVPYTAPVITAGEEISYRKVQYRYKLGSWRLGQYPFALADGGGVLKVADVKSVQPALLNDIAAYVESSVHGVLLNNSVSITEFRTKAVDENVVSVEYAVTPDDTSLITNIKLLGADGEVLTEAAVYVPVSQTVLSKHIITVKEGA